MVSSLPGTTWRRSGTPPSTTSCESLPTSLLIFTPRLPSTPRPTEKSSYRSSSRPSTLPLPMCASRPSSPCTLPVVPPVSSSTSEMASLTPSPSMRVTPFPTPSCVSTWPDATLSATSRRSFATSLSTSSRRWPPPPPPPPSRSPTSFPTVRSLPSATSVSAAQSPCSAPLSSVWRLSAFMRAASTPSRSLTSISARTCTPTPSFPEAPPCTPVSPIVCRRRSPHWLLPPCRSRSSLLPRESTPSGSEAPSWLPFPPSRRCGSPSRSSTSLAPESSTASASKNYPQFICFLIFLFFHFLIQSHDYTRHVRKIDHRYLRTDSIRSNFKLTILIVFSF